MPKVKASLPRESSFGRRGLFRGCHALWCRKWKIEWSITAPQTPTPHHSHPSHTLPYSRSSWRPSSLLRYLKVHDRL